MSATLTTDHRCSTHKFYELSCEDHVELVARAEGRCERCFAECHRLNIDHDHALGMAGIRGLICHPCNVRLGGVDAGTIAADSEDLNYLSRAWHLRYEALPYVGDNRTTARTVRVDDELWKMAQEKAKRRRETVAAVLKRALLAYVEDE